MVGAGWQRNSSHAQLAGSNLCQHPHCLHAGTGHGTPTQGSPAQEDVPSSPDDASDEIMDQLVKSVTYNPNPRPCPNKERRRSRGNRKSCKSHPCVLVPCSISVPRSVPVLCPISMSVSLLRCFFPALCPCPLTLSHLFVSIAMPSPISLPRLCPIPMLLFISVSIAVLFHLHVSVLCPLSFVPLFPCPVWLLPHGPPMTCHAEPTRQDVP